MGSASEPPVWANEQRGLGWVFLAVPPASYLPPSPSSDLLCSEPQEPRPYSSLSISQPTSCWVQPMGGSGGRPEGRRSESSVQLLTRVRPFATPWTAAHQVSLSITNSQSLLTSIESVMPSNHLILCHPVLLPPSIFPSIRVFSIESVLRIRWPKYWSLSFNISPSNEHPGLISFRMDRLISLQSEGLSGVFSNTTVQKHQFFGAQLSLWSNSHIHTRPLGTPQP